MQQLFVAQSKAVSQSQVSQSQMPPSQHSHMIDSGALSKVPKASGVATSAVNTPMLSKIFANIFKSPKDVYLINIQTINLGSLIQPRAQRGLTLVVFERGQNKRKRCLCASSGRTCREKWPCDQLSGELMLERIKQQDRILDTKRIAFAIACFALRATVLARRSRFNARAGASATVVRSTTGICSAAFRHAAF